MVYLEALVVLVLAQEHVVAVVPATGFQELAQRQHPRRPQQPVAVVFVAQLREKHLPSTVVRLQKVPVELVCPALAGLRLVRDA